MNWSLQLSAGGAGTRCVAHVTQSLHMGGQEKLLVEFARHADRSRFRLIFVSLGETGVLASQIERCGWPVYCLNQSHGLRPRIGWRLSALFRREKVDVIHTHDMRPLVYGSLAARLGRGRRLIHTRHGQSLDLSRRQLLLLRAAARRVDDFVCVSRDAACIARLQGISPNKVVTIENGIDIARFADLRASEDGPIVTVARLSPEKNISGLLKALAIARRQEPRQRLRLVIVGGGVCRPALEEETSTLGLSDCVRFVGEAADVSQWLGGARLFVLPSHTEGVSLTILEAMAAGVPVIATRVGGTPEVVHDQQTGLLVPPRNPAALAEAILRLWRQRSERERLAERARRYVSESFCVRNMVRRYESLYLPEEAENQRHCQGRSSSGGSSYSQTSNGNSTQRDRSVVQAAVGGKSC
jgi:sugar transferase (PEP-CTERM/EpsH1 system associated)